MDGVQKERVCYDRALLDKCAARYGATLVGEYDNLKAKTMITYICKCGKKNTKKFENVNIYGCKCNTCTKNDAKIKMNDTKQSNIKYDDSICFLYPDIAGQWHPTKNGDLKPENVSPGSGLVVWWMCNTKTECGCIHEYPAIVGNRCREGSGCPFCAGHKICIHNSLLYKDPEIAKMWHPTKNGDLKPENVSRYSHIIAWWLCSQGHESEIKIANKVGCLDCYYEDLSLNRQIKEEKENEEKKERKKKERGRKN